MLDYVVADGGVIRIVFCGADDLKVLYCLGQNILNSFPQLPLFVDSAAERDSLLL